MCVVIPIYKNALTKNEKLSVQSYLKYFKEYPLVFIAPEKIDEQYYRNLFPKIEIRKYDNRYFRSNKTYNKLMLSPEFYEGFSDYEYMLVAQTDAIVITLNANFDYFLSGAWDYIGAPWYTPIIKKYTIKDFIKLLVIHHPNYCQNGNGGFSLRNIAALTKLLKKDRIYIKLLWWFNEDIYFTYRGQATKALRIADRDTSEKFALEENMKEQLTKGVCPVALHAWEKYFSSYKELEELVKVK